MAAVAIAATVVQSPHLGLTWGSRGRPGLGGLDAQNCRARRADAGLLLRRSKRELDLRRRRSGSGGPSSLLEDPRALEGEEASPRWDEMGVAEQVAQCAIRTIDYVRHGRHEERVSGGVAATERCVGGSGPGAG
ncbi:hypothetical protein EMIHUDRAFT_198443 [Emiliania huxleyi CCMP1516]|uniref:Uncharacterized protein n=2 Tax=Emiliania huxleyi TaxID=2903 RepID=A0A0D3I7A1_EMIH1|nr:hypothetical protein EMIHUDRAFT_198443 [Emiliania huxleyi CCMP1516]EOD07136.1 hypothetical protein EMIHUDRAFT_198443 [Emiliania huxleyi CCMP1516]|eukprot:XP_005759565.1 hypothetical protein EMIHUDRAFT_198443 [Emiliania huxleyi CCMP1516]